VRSCDAESATLVQGVETSDRPTNLCAI